MKVELKEYISLAIMVLWGIGVTVGVLGIIFNTTIR